jgi:hypothetical protein
MKDKLVFSTIHQTKGLQRKVVILFNFDNSYFKFYNRNANPLICSNELYVATTRASECLTLIHDYTNPYLPFLEKEILFNEIDIINKKPINIKFSINKKNKEISVTRLLSHLDYNVLDQCYNMLEINKNNNEIKKINIPSQITQKTTENVSELNGIAIVAYCEYKNNNTCPILDILSNNTINIRIKSDIKSKLIILINKLLI